MTHHRRRVFAVAILLASAACARKGGGDEAAPEKAEVAAETAMAAEGPFVETLDAIGTIVPRPGHVAALSAPAPTRVANVNVVAGQHVRAGDTLILLEQGTFQSSLASAQSAVATATAARDRAQRLFDQGIAPRRDLDQASADLARANSDLVQARRQAELSVIRAPIAGVVTKMSTSLGASVDPSQVLVEVADPAEIDLMLALAPADAARVPLGAKVTVQLGDIAGHSATLGGDVSDIASIVDSVTRTVAVRVKLSGATSAVRLGQTVSGTVSLGTVAHAITIPVAALVPEGDGFKVFVVDSGSVAHARPVTVGARHDAIAEIRAGLKGGERVVTTGAFGVDDGATIVAPGAANAKPDSGKEPAHDSTEKP